MRVEEHEWQIARDQLTGRFHAEEAELQAVRNAAPASAVTA